MQVQIQGNFGDNLRRKNFVTQYTIRLKMIIISDSLYPLESSDEIVKRISEMPPLPDFISLKGPYARFISKSRIKSISIYEFGDLEFPKAFEYIANRISSFSGVNGFTYNIRIWYEEQELFNL